MFKRKGPVIHPITSHTAFQSAIVGHSKAPSRVKKYGVRAAIAAAIGLPLLYFGLKKEPAKMPANVQTEIRQSAEPANASNVHKVEFQNRSAKPVAQSSVPSNHISVFRKQFGKKADGISDRTIQTIMYATTNAFGRPVNAKELNNALVAVKTYLRYEQNEGGNPFWELGNKSKAHADAITRDRARLKDTKLSPRTRKSLERTVEINMQEVERIERIQSIVDLMQHHYKEMSPAEQGALINFLKSVRQ